MIVMSTPDMMYLYDFLRSYFNFCLNFITPLLGTVDMNQDPPNADTHD